MLPVRVEFRTLSSRPPAPHPKNKKIVARKIAAQAPHEKPNAYLPMVAVIPFLLKASRALTNSALRGVSESRLCHGGKDLRHQRYTQSVEEEGAHEDQTGKARCKTAAWSKEGSEECEDSASQTDDIENPSETPQIVEVLARSTLSKGAAIDQ